VAKKPAKPSASKRATSPASANGPGRRNPAPKPSANKPTSMIRPTKAPKNTSVRAPKGSNLTNTSASVAKPTKPAPKTQAAKATSASKSPAKPAKPSAKSPAIAAETTAPKPAKSGKTTSTAKSGKPSTSRKPSAPQPKPTAVKAPAPKAAAPKAPAFKAPAKSDTKPETKPAPAADKNSAKGEKPAKGARDIKGATSKGAPQPTKGDAKSDGAKGGVKPALKERYSFPAAEAVAAGQAAAARLAAAAGLQPIQATLNGDTEEEVLPRLTKSPFAKKELRHFREILLAKRRQLIGDVTSMESEALTGGSGSLSHLPQHMADQGSDTYDQTLALDLAASQRTLLKEINDALDRIDHGAYGVCERLGKPISPERLEHTPWARFSIEAARQLERTTYQR